MMAHSTSQTQKYLSMALISFLVVYVCSVLNLQAFLYSYVQIGAHVGASAEAATLITALPSIVTGISSFIAASLADFISVKKIFIAGIVICVVGSLLGFFGNMAGVATQSLTCVVVARCIQTFGGQVAGPCFLVLVACYLEGRTRVLFYGLFNAGYQIAAALGAIASGYLAHIANWQALFLLPLCSLVCVGPCLYGLTKVGAASQSASQKSQHIDVVGFTLFTVFTSSLITAIAVFGSAFVSIPLALASFVGFVLWITHAREPFITPDFFKNKRWVLSVSILFLFWLSAYGVMPLINAVAGPVFAMSSSAMALWLCVPILGAVISSVCSGALAHTLGHARMLLLATVFEVVSFCLAAYALEVASFVLFMLALVLYWMGYAAIYAPLVDIIIGCVKPQAHGRAFGMNDLLLFVSPSVGLALFGVLMPTQAMQTADVVGNASTLFLLYCIPALAAFVLYAVVKKFIQNNN